MSDEIDLEATQALALAEKYAYEAEFAKWQAERERLQFVDEELNHKWQLDGTYSLNKKITEKSVEKLLQGIEMWHHHDDSAPWTITLNSPGGYVFPGLALIDELIRHSHRGKGTHHVTIRVRGLAASMAAMILQAADERVIGPNAMLMIHKVSGGATGTHDYVQDEAEWLQRSTDQMIDLFLSRGMNLDRDRVMPLIDRRDWWISPREAVKYGLADRIG